MKVKSDFVTNSSSTSYIFCIPKDFDLMGYLMHDLDPNDEEDSNFMQAIHEFINTNSLPEYETPEEFNKMANLLSSFEIASVDVPSDQGQLQLLFFEDIKKQIEGKVSEYENKK